MRSVKTFYVFFLITCLSCTKDFDTDTSPKADFELFFEYLKNDYAYRDYHAFSMEELRQKYLPQIEGSNTKRTLATILLEIQENELKDPHLFVISDEPYNLSSVPETIGAELETLEPFLLADITENTRTDFYISGTVTSNPSIGYFQIRAFNYDIGGEESLSIQDGVKEIDTILQALIDKGITSMIVDMRSDAGGSNYVPRYIAQRFIDKTTNYMSEYYPVGNIFVKKEWEISPAGTGFRTGNIALLSNGLTASGGEFFVLAMLNRDNLIHIGSNTLGASGNITEKDLSNGWNIQITNSRTEFTNGNQYFKVGITPSITVRNSFEFKYDPLIRTAIERLSGDQFTNLR